MPPFVPVARTRRRRRAPRPYGERRNEGRANADNLTRPRRRRTALPRFPIRPPLKAIALTVAPLPPFRDTEGAQAHASPSPG